MHKLHRLFALVSFTAVIALNTNAAVYDPTAELSITNGNPNGVWSYGYSEDLDIADFSANFTLMGESFSNTFGTGWSKDSNGPTVAVNTSGTTQYLVPPGMLTQHPGPLFQPSLLRFTAPESANANIAGEYFAGDDGIMALAVLVNGSAVWTSTNAGTFNFNTTLSAGGTVDFAVFGGYGFGNTPLALSITTAAVPEPASSAALAGVVLLGLAATRRRRRA